MSLKVTVTTSPLPWHPPAKQPPVLSSPLSPTVCRQNPRPSDGLRALGPLPSSSVHTYLSGSLMDYTSPVPLATTSPLPETLPPR